MPASYLVRYRGRHYICRPGVVVAPHRDTDPADTHSPEMVHRLCWAERDTGAVICHDGDEDSVTTLEDDE